MTHPPLHMACLAALAAVGLAACQRSDRTIEPPPALAAPAPAPRDAAAQDAASQAAPTDAASPAVAPPAAVCGDDKERLPEPPSQTCPAPSAAISTRLAPLLRKLAGGPRVTAHIATACPVADGWIATAQFHDPGTGPDVDGAPTEQRWELALRLPATGAPSKLDAWLQFVTDVDGDGTAEPVTTTTSTTTAAEIKIWFASGEVRFVVPPNLGAVWTIHDARPVLLATDANADYNPLHGFTKLYSKAYTFTRRGAEEQPAILAALWQRSRGGRCPGTVSDDVGEFDLGHEDPPPPRLHSLPASPCEPVSTAERRPALAALMQHRRLVAAEEGTHSNYTSVEWICTPDHRPTAWVWSQYIGAELWELAATGSSATRLRPRGGNSFAMPLGAADFDGDGSSTLIFAFSSPLGGPPFDTDIVVRYRGELQTIAHSSRAQPEPFIQIVRLPGGTRDGLVFHAGPRWRWETSAPKLLATANGHFVDVAKQHRQLLIDATASERAALRKAEAPAPDAR